MTQSLWDLAIRQNKLKEEKSNIDESVFVFCGSKSCGKSVIINAFLEKEETPKSTLALEYCFGRKIIGPGKAKSIVHIWELGGGPKLSHLLDVTVSKESLNKLCFIVVLDLSLPNELWNTLVHFLKAYENRITQVLERIAQNSSESFRQHILTQAQIRIEANHIDRELINIFPVRLIIIGSKMDLFMKFKIEDQSLIARTLRFAAHYHGGSLFFTNALDLMSSKRIINYLNHIAFGSPKSTLPPVFEEKPLSILTGQDSFDLIGLPLLDANIKMTDKTLIDLWGTAYSKRFPQKNVIDSTKLSEEKKGLTDEDKFLEEQVDQIRQKKDEELERYLRESERSMREQLQQAATSGLFVV